MTQTTNSFTNRLIFVNGKGGVGKTVVSRAIALALSRTAKRTLWVTFEDPRYPMGETIEIAPRLKHLNCEATRAFEEYAGLKIGAAPLTRVFLQNKLMRYLSKAAPGIHELVLLGKVWHERLNYDHVVVDMPSTGYGLAMFQSTQNFSRLFKGGPIHKDAEAMLETFGDPSQTRHLILALPEEMPLQESLELNDFLRELFPRNPARFMVNRLFPRLPTSTDASTREGSETLSPSSVWTSPVARSSTDYLERRLALENYNLRLWREKKIDFQELNFVPPAQDSNSLPVVEKLSEEIRRRGYLGDSAA